MSISHVYSSIRQMEKIQGETGLIEFFLSQSPLLSFYSQKYLDLTGAFLLSLYLHLTQS